jgi:nucleotide-binding universal stress UspA family protein
MVEKNILVPIDFTDINKSMVRIADAWANRTGAMLYFLHVVGDITYRYLDPDIQNVFHTHDKEIIDGIVTRMEQFVGEQKVVAPHEYIVREGKPHKGILDAQKEYNIDLIIIGAHDHKEIGRLFIGNNTDRVLHHVHCPVYVYKEVSA